MKTLMLAAIAALAVANASPALANAGPKTFDAAVPQVASVAQAAASPHWEWQYGYVGHHARFAGQWVLVR